MSARLADAGKVVDLAGPLTPCSVSRRRPITLPEHANRTLAFANSDVMSAFRETPSCGQVVRSIRQTVGRDFEIIELRGPSRRRWIKGIASTPATDDQLTSLDPAGCLMSLPLPLLFCHAIGPNGKAASKDLNAMKIGEVVLLHRDAARIWMEAVIFDSRAGDAAWDHIKAGRARALSVGAVDLEPRGHVDGRTFIDQWKLTEISVCYSGSNPEAICTVGGEYDVDFV